MADRYYSVPLGGGIASNNVTESATATPAAFVDVRVTYDAAGSNKTVVYNAIKAAADRILQGNWPPV